MWKLIYVYIFLFSLFLSLILTKLWRKIALRLTILLDNYPGRKIHHIPKPLLVDKPSERKIHEVPKPLLGGVAIYLAFTLTVLVNMIFVFLCVKRPAFSSLLPDTIIGQLRGAPVVWDKLIVILIGVTLMMVLGLLDDLYNIRFRIKLAAQVILALLLVCFGIRITLFIPNVYLSGLITVIWIVGITNAFNLLDNMDGLSAGVGLIAAIIFSITALQQGQLFVTAILVAFAGSLAGFLKHNFHPSSIFMGDAGSLFLGYTLASLTVLNTYYSVESPTLFPVIMPILILGVPIFDTFSVICLRLKSRQSIFEADKRHFSHRLVNLGMTQRRAVLLVYLVTFCVGINAILLRSVQMWGALVILVQVIAIFGIIISLELAARKRRDE